MSRLLNSYRSLADRNRGFTLLEVLVAFSILTLALGVLLALFSSGMRNTAISHDYSKAITLAESRLESVGVTDPLRPGERDGKYDENYRWHTEIAPQIVNDDYASKDKSWRLYRVTVQVIWESLDGERSVTLTTLRMITLR